MGTPERGFRRKTMEETDSVSSDKLLSLSIIIVKVYQGWIQVTSTTGFEESTLHHGPLHQFQESRVLIFKGFRLF